MSRSPTQDDSIRLLDEQVIDLDLESSEGEVEDDTSLQSEENVCVKCLFSDETFLSAAAMLEHAKSTHRFDLLSVVEALSVLAVTLPTWLWHGLIINRS